MNINKELLQFYTYKKLIKRKKAPEILQEFKARKSNVRDYLLAKEMITETNELEARAAYYCMPCVESDMLDIDDHLFDAIGVWRERSVLDKAIIVRSCKLEKALVAKDIRLTALKEQH